MSVLNDLLSRITETGRALIGPGRGEGALISQAQALLAHDGEASGIAHARAMLDQYEMLDGEAKRAFFLAAAAELGPDRDRLDDAIASYQSSGSEEDARRLHRAGEPRSQELIRRLNRAPGGTRALVGMRADLLRLLREAPELAGLDEDFRHLLAAWFNRGFLELRRIDWNTPAAILEKIIRYEAVHQIGSWDDLRQRVGAPDRQLYGFFHPALDDDPLIFVEIALTQAMPDAIEPILTEDRETVDPRKAKTAVFYSISNCQPGLRGISFGNFLIKQVVEELRRDVPSLSSFVTLSPMPGFRRWCEAEWTESYHSLLNEAEGELVQSLIRREDDNNPEDAQLAVIAAKYLAAAKRPDGGPVDPVARFHLGNGARLERINLAGDLGPRGRETAYGVMVNYLYDLDDIEKNHEAFAQNGEIAQSAAVRKLLRQG